MLSGFISPSLLLIVAVCLITLAIALQRQWLWLTRFSLVGLLIAAAMVVKYQYQDLQSVGSCLHRIENPRTIQHGCMRID
ncbi:hypothetical protein [Photobacterium galatheae]|uniref:Uncharacterized protein n=1 Tax=Photobacterium galatheae TaxID=1654360 RepID=A0A066RN28_9GAMM|nr:hypothetical protein [Photobacterium galatheae]KDM91734.1 hypothetical protein EA58_10215 [Photobacterium galatheae]MCM0149844.1 hypothetical protein [Photobacterium galatheae]